ncbi:MAG: hypothetical protein IJ364_09475 [Oscillospiraceae bacterium]|nr:hypothetical protein [Oscillospiraceae bacterium]
MQTDEFELAFSNFLDRREYDEAETALFSIVRAAFLAGWNAAGGANPEPQPVLQIPKNPEYKD